MIKNMFIPEEEHSAPIPVTEKDANRLTNRLIMNSLSTLILLKKNLNTSKKLIIPNKIKVLISYKPFTILAIKNPSVPVL